MYKVGDNVKLVYRLTVSPHIAIGEEGEIVRTLIGFPDDAQRYIVRFGNSEQRAFETELALVGSTEKKKLNPIEELVALGAKIQKEYYDQLIKQGFTKNESLELCKAVSPIKAILGGVECPGQRDQN